MNNMKRVVVALADKSTLPAIARAIEGANAEMLHVAYDGDTAVDAINRLLTDVFICDMVLPKGDGCALIERIVTLPVQVMPTVILLTTVGMTWLDEEAMRLGAYKVLKKPVSNESLVQAIGSATIETRLTRTTIDERKIADRLYFIGLSSKLIGTAFLSTAVFLTLKDRRIAKSLTTELYPMVGEKHGVDGKCVERCMRRAIESAWSMGALDQQHRVFGYTIDARRGKPTCGEMIARVADSLRIEE